MPRGYQIAQHSDTIHGACTGLVWHSRRTSKDLLFRELEPQHPAAQSTVGHRIPPTSHSLQKSRMEAPSVNSELSSHSSCEIAGNVCSQAVPHAGYLEPSRLMSLISEAPAPMSGLPSGTPKEKCSWNLFCFRGTQECIFGPMGFLQF